MAIATATAIHGIARLGRRTKDLVKRLGPADIAVIDHRNLDRIAAEELIACGVRATLNASRSSDGSYPNTGPLALVRAGVPLIDAGPELFDLLEDGDRLEIAGGRVSSEGRPVAEGRPLHPEQLGMSGARLEISLEPHPEGFGALGQERVAFRVATNPGMPTSPLRDAASGGELSRLMLALAGQGAPGGAATYVFDEIDAGVGGNTARTVGERLRELGQERQVLCITHLPQVASMAQSHFRIEKNVDRGQATATVERVDGDELVAEIVRMLGGGDGDEAADRHARELLKAA